MADLDEIMAGKDAPASQPEMNAETQPPAQEPASNDAGQDSQAGGDNEQNGLRQALDAERGKSRRYKENQERLERQIADLSGEFRIFAQTVQQQRAAPQAPPQKVDPPDLWNDPNGFVGHVLDERLAPVQQALMAQREYTSRMIATEKHGEEAVSAAYQAMAAKLRTDPNAQFEYQRIMQSPHPYGALVGWHQQQSTLSEIGGDLKGYRERILSEEREAMRQQIIAEMQGSGGASPQQQAGTGQAMPSSFSGARNQGARQAQAWTGPLPLSEIMKR